MYGDSEKFSGPPINPMVKGLKAAASKSPMEKQKAGNPNELSSMKCMDRVKTLDRDHLMIGSISREIDQDPYPKWTTVDRGQPTVEVGCKSQPITPGLL